MLAPLPRIAIRRLAAASLFLSLTLGGCRFFSRGGAQSTPPPGPAVSPSVFAHGYTSYSMRQPVAIPVAQKATLNLVTGLLVAVGEAFPRSPDEASRKDFTRLARERAEKQAREGLREAMDSLMVRGYQPADDPNRPMSMRQAIRAHPALGKQVEGLLRTARVLSARKETWTYRVELGVDMTPLKDKIANFDTRLYSTTVMLAVPPAPFQAGAPLPDFRLTNVASGRPMSLANVPGKVTVVIFWVTDDYASVEAVGRLNQYAQRMRDRGVTALGIVSRGDPAMAKTIVQRRRIAFPNVFDERSAYSKKVAVHAHPLFAVVKRTNKNAVTFTNWGNTDAHFVPSGMDNLHQQVLRALAAQP